MPHCNLPTPQLCQMLLGKHVPHQAQILMDTDHPAVVDRNAAALLSPVLQSEQRIVGVCRHITPAFFVIDAKNAAFFVNFVLHTSFLPNCEQGRRCPALPVCVRLDYSPNRRFMIS